MNGRVDLLELEGRVCIEVLLRRYWIFDTEIGFDLAIFGMSQWLAAAGRGCQKLAMAGRGWQD